MTILDRPALAERRIDVPGIGQGFDLSDMGPIPLSVPAAPSIVGRRGERFDFAPWEDFFLSPYEPGARLDRIQVVDAIDLAVWLRDHPSEYKMTEGVRGSEAMGSLTVGSVVINELNSGKQNPLDILCSGILIGPYVEAVQGKDRVCSLGVGIWTNKYRRKL